MSYEDIPARDFGKLEAQVDAIDRRGENIARQLGELRTEVKNINKTLSEARGGWKTLLWVSGFASTVGAIVTWIATHIKIV